eukprot:CAMPEP_0181181152 /NCGR_PEP_ID=MMETSP1096-20121128/7184_1 /TAXON_ID=156174 ORGANISM="Chrysochromulina ericina, Strain CCMP281" /NCGR_SAMPLE_ID=MMETSP1096 /ASSEMBLY_ACC=CAM_ASM_000453 /LENGTH=59 /DNA_ID=CAMNT_0023269635 /DNA_START=207 /DNA_END=384 /DNA_ORIENTATION=-
MRAAEAATLSELVGATELEYVEEDASREDGLVASPEAADTVRPDNLARNVHEAIGGSTR